MAGILNTLYVALIVITVLAGLGIILQHVNNGSRGGPRWLDFLTIGVALLFVLALAGQSLL